MSLPGIIALMLALGSLFAYFVIGARRRREIRTLDDFLLYGRGLSTEGYQATFVATSISLATVFFFFLDFTGPLGLALLLYPLIDALGCYVFLRILPRLDSSGYLKRGSTIHNFIATAFESEPLRYSAAAVSVLGYLGILIIEIHVGTTIFSIFSPKTEWLVLVVVFLLCLIFVYTYLGGYRAVIDTDKVQLLLIALGTIATLGSLLVLNWEKTPANPIGTFEKLAPLPWLLPPAFIVVMIIGNVPFQMLRMSNWLRATSVGKLEDVRKGLRRSIVATFIAWFLFSVIGLLLFRLVTTGPGQGATSLFSLLEISGGFHAIVSFPLIFAACVAALVSTADSVFMPVLTAWIYDFRFPIDLHNDDGTARIVSDEEEQRKHLRAARRSIVFFLLLAVAIYLVLTQILSFEFVDLLFVFFNQQLVLFPTVVLALVVSKKAGDKGRSRGAATSALVGLWTGWASTWASSIYGTLMEKGDWVLYASAIGFGVSIVTTLIVSPRAIARILRG